MHRAAPLGPVDIAIGATVAGSAAVDHIARTAAQGGPVREAVRFVDHPILQFTWDEVPVFLTVTDTIALLSATILLVRFGVWAFGPPLWAVLKVIFNRMRRRHG